MLTILIGLYLLTFSAFDYFLFNIFQCRGFAYGNRTEPAPIECVLGSKQYDRVVDQALRDAQNFLWANLPSTHDLPADRTVACLRAIMGRPEVGQALERGSDTVLCMALRSLNRILADKAQPPRPTIDRVWAILDEPELNRALGTTQSRMKLWRKKPPSR